MSSATRRPLEGIQVLDFSRVLAGPWAAQALADFGADVIKIERPGKGDDSRAWGPPFLKLRPDEGVAAYFCAANRGKKSIALDISDPADSEIVRQLASKADVLIENFKTGTMARHGLDYAALSAINPRLVFCSITGYGKTAARPVLIPIVRPTTPLSRAWRAS
jgi:crotonobetainyl-CoA:carnitine CoA-transferase CaiB-like acyl-CoA transferase